MQVGDLVVRTYGEGQRPTALIVGWYSPLTHKATAEVIWEGSNKVLPFETKYLEVINESK